jgi:hypothetical protein
VAIQSRVGPTQVVRHDKNDIGFCGKHSAKQAKEREGMEEDVLRAGVHEILM